MALHRPEAPVVHTILHATARPCRGDPVGRPAGPWWGGTRDDAGHRARPHQGDAPRRPYRPYAQPPALHQQTAEHTRRTSCRGGSRTAPTVPRTTDPRFLSGVVSEEPQRLGICRIDLLQSPQNGLRFRGFSRGQQEFGVIQVRRDVLGIQRQ